MKRNIDLWRHILIAIEENHQLLTVTTVEPEWISVYNEINDEDKKIEMSIKIREQTYLMAQAGLIYATSDSGGVYIKGITPSGYDFIDAIRDKDIWEQTKDMSKKVGGGTIEFIRDLGIGFLKTQVKKHTGIEM